MKSIELQKPEMPPLRIQSRPARVDPVNIGTQKPWVRWRVHSAKPGSLSNICKMLLKCRSSYGRLGLRLLLLCLLSETYFLGCKATMPCGLFL